MVDQPVQVLTPRWYGLAALSVVFGGMVMPHFIGFRFGSDSSPEIFALTILCCVVATGTVICYLVLRGSDPGVVKPP